VKEILNRKMLTSNNNNINVISNNSNNDQNNNSIEDINNDGNSNNKSFININSCITKKLNKNIVIIKTDNKTATNNIKNTLKNLFQT